MAVRPVSPNIGTVRFGMSRVRCEPSMNLGMARKIYEHAGEASGIEIHVYGVPIPDLSDSGAVCQDVKTGKSVDFVPRFDAIGLGSRRL
jgi:hypothetical protein